MLKIKDNVDLKELEKFGYVYDEDAKCYRYGIEIIVYKEIDKNNKPMLMKELPNLKPKEIITIKRFYGQSAVYKYAEENDIQNLIKADLVEKVVKSNE